MKALLELIASISKNNLGRKSGILATTVAPLLLVLVGVLFLLEWQMGFPPAIRQIYILPLWLATRLGGLHYGAPFLAIVVTLHTGTDWSLDRYGPAELWMNAILRFVALSSLMLLIHQVESSMQRNRELAHYDPLTGLLNRRGLTQLAHHTIDRAQRMEERIVVMMIDCNNFKAINDKYGHEVGDNILQILARILESETRYGDLVARLGGDEFLVVLQDVTDHAAASFHLRISNAFREATSFLHEDLSISVGPAFLGTDGRTVDELVASADRAMYRLKSLTKERTRVSA